jgi:hypothetical protein
MEDSDLDSFNVSFIDIVKNFLGLLILILVLIQGSAALTEASRAPLRAAKVESPHPFSAPLRDYLHPFTDHYYVAANRIVLIDLGKLGSLIEIGALEEKRKESEVALFLDDPAPTKVSALRELPSRYWWQESDLNVFELGLTFPSLAPAELPDDKQLGELLRMIVGKTQNGLRGVHFHVADSGFRLFSAVYQALNKLQVCFRWYAFKTGQTVTLERTTRHFQYHRSRKCSVRR